MTSLLERDLAAIVSINGMPTLIQKLNRWLIRLCSLTKCFGQHLGNFTDKMDADAVGNH